MLNRDDKRRHEILGLDYDPKEKYDIKLFRDLNLNDLNALVSEGFAKVEDQQNDAPTIQQFIDFLSENDNHHKYTVVGYIVSPTRVDYRVSIEKLSSTAYKKDAQDVLNFLNFCLVRLGITLVRPMT